MVSSEKVVFPNNRKQRISGRIYRGDENSLTGVIYCHGLFSDKDGYKITRLADTIVSAGTILLSFDFSFAGESPGDISEISLLQEVEDLGSAVAFFRDKTGISGLHLIGSSMGGAVALLYASRPGHGIKSVITIAAPADIENMADLMFSVSDKGIPPAEGMTFVEGHNIKNRFYHELKSVDMISQLKKIDVPVLAIHGGRDEVVDIKNIHLIRENIKSSCRTHIIESGDHSLVRDMDIAVLGDLIISWLREVR